MEIKYTVHSATPTAIEVDAVINGVTVPVTAQGFIVELVSEDQVMTHTLKAMPGPDCDFLAANFPVGASVVGTFAVAQPAS